MKTNSCVLWDLMMLCWLFKTLTVVVLVAGECPSVCRTVFLSISMMYFLLPLFLLSLSIMVSLSHCGGYSSSSSVFTSLFLCTMHFLLHHSHHFFFHVVLSFYKKNENFIFNILWKYFFLILINLLSGYLC